MVIANPIYDVVFKYLLEDLDIAKGLLSTITGEDIESVVVQPQELTIRKALKDEVIRIVRLDFKATVKLASGNKKMMLMELQKAKKLFDIMRFREYLGENYKKGEQITNDLGEVETNPIPILTIYFLGFKLETTTAPVVKVNRVYYDVIADKPLSPEIREPFIESLTHDSFVIQIPNLNTDSKSKLEKLLNIFNQAQKIPDDRHKLIVSDEDQEDVLLNKIIKRLHSAVQSEEIIAEMLVEDEIERLFGKVEKQLDDTKKKLATERSKSKEKDKLIVAERQKAEQERQKAEAKDKELNAERQKAAQLAQELAELKKLLGK